jgi:hypothetical protein
MEKTNIHEMINDLKAKRDALSLAHEQLKKDNDDWNKCVIVLSLTTGMIESAKLQLNWNNPICSLTPILLTSIIASISALIKFKKFPEQMETLIKSTSLITNTLSKCRNYIGDPDNVEHITITEYNDALEKLETSVYPDIRKKYLKISHMNLAKIMKYEKFYFNQIEKSNNSNVSVSDMSSDKDEGIYPFQKHRVDSDEFDEDILNTSTQKVRLSRGAQRTRRNNIPETNEKSIDIKPLENEIINVKENNVEAVL